MRYLVTGGSGFIGSHIAELLLALPDADVVVLDNLSVGLRENVPDAAVFVQGDICDPLTVRQVMAGVDVVFHEAAFVSIRGSFTRLHDDFATNGLGTLTVFEEAARANVRKVVFASSMAVYGNPATVVVSEQTPAAPNSPYGLSKLRGEMMLRMFAETHGFEAVALRYFNTFGTRQTPSDYVGVMTTFIRQALTGVPLTVYGDGNQTRDFIHVGDVARANVLAAADGVSGVFNVGTGIELSVNALAARVLDVVGGSVEHHPAPPGEIPRIRADIRLATNALAFEPYGDLGQLMPHVVAYWADRLDVPRPAGVVSLYPAKRSVA